MMKKYVVISKRYNNDTDTHFLGAVESMWTSAIDAEKRAEVMAQSAPNTRMQKIQTLGYVVAEIKLDIEYEINIRRIS